MSRWVVIFEDTSEMVEYRKKQGTKHAEYALANQSKLLIGGGFRKTESSPYSGGMWVMEVDTREQAITLIENDPYYHPDYRKYKLYLWSKILEDAVVIL